MKVLKTTENYEGLGGWLILVGLGIMVSTFSVMVSTVLICVQLVSSGSWEMLATPGAARYNPLWVPIMVGAIAIDAGFTIAWLFIAFLFFSKKKSFPVWYIGMIVITLLFILADGLATNRVLPGVAMIGPYAKNEFVRQLIAAFIWIPYMLVSKRVKATFVR